MLLNKKLTMKFVSANRMMFNKLRKWKNCKKKDACMLKKLKQKRKEIRNYRNKQT